MLKYNNKFKTYARQLRANATDAEQKLWRGLRGKQIGGVQFYRQKSIGEFIVDFYGPKAGLVIEIDGGQHFEEAYRKKDAVRDEWLGQQGLKVLRFDNMQVLNETVSVLEAIWRECKERLEIGEQSKSPCPPFAKGEPAAPRD